MALRLIEISLPQAEADSLRELVDEQSVIGFWREAVPDGGYYVKVLLSADRTEALLDQLEKQFAHRPGFRVVMLPVEATIPRYQDEAAAEGTTATASDGEDEPKSPSRVSREELHAQVVDGVRLSRVYVAMVVLSAIVASIGLLRDNVAVVIGAMVIAPLLHPNVALALATTLGDLELGRTALRTNLVGLGIALGLSLAIGFWAPVDATGHEIESRTVVQLSDVVIAAASGSAGVLAFTSGFPTAVIGVMVSVALLPPLATFGLLFGSGQVTAAGGALLLVLTNVICVNLAGVVTFLFQGVGPRTWWEAATAKRATRLAIALWSVLLLVLIALILISRGPPPALDVF